MIVTLSSIIARVTAELHQIPQANIYKDNWPPSMQHISVVLTQYNQIIVLRMMYVLLRGKIKQTKKLPTKPKQEELNQRTRQIIQHNSQRQQKTKRKLIHWITESQQLHKITGNN
ncbi:Hypothetical_protein [Hexamita inflata]|uniref:Hypothetical_protein n=1 Tax=Hexamita inflata TaxID=28002 RepID=A0ABP1HMJ4_9EUKA